MPAFDEVDLGASAFKPYLIHQMPHEFNASSVIFEEPVVVGRAGDLAGVESVAGVPHYDQEPISLTGDQAMYLLRAVLLASMHHGVGNCLLKCQLYFEFGICQATVFVHEIQRLFNCRADVFDSSGNCQM